MITFGWLFGRCIFKIVTSNLWKSDRPVSIVEADLRGGGGSARPPYFLQSPVFCNHSEELQTVLFEVELIINNAPLTYAYPNTIKT